MAARRALCLLKMESKNHEAVDGNEVFKTPYKCTEC